MKVMLIFHKYYINKYFFILSINEKILKMELFYYSLVPIITYFSIDQIHKVTFNHQIQPFRYMNLYYHFVFYGYVYSFIYFSTTEN